MSVVPSSEWLPYPAFFLVPNGCHDMRGSRHASCQNERGSMATYAIMSVIVTQDGQSTRRFRKFASSISSDITIEKKDTAGPDSHPLRDS